LLNLCRQQFQEINPLLKKLTTTVILLAGLVTLLPAQEMEDSLTVERDIQFLKEYLAPPELPMPSILSPDQLDFKSKEEVAAMVDMMVATDVTSSVDYYLQWSRSPKLAQWQRALLIIGSFFLPFTSRFPEGYVPLMNHSFPFIYAKTPGMAPYDNPYSPENFPQCIRSEYDSSTGTYKQVMVDWAEFEKNMSERFVPSINTQPIPKMPVTPVERMMP